MLKNLLMGIVALMLVGGNAKAEPDYLIAMKTLRCQIGYNMMLKRMESTKWDKSAEEMIKKAIKHLKSERSLWAGRTIILIARVHKVSPVGYGYKLNKMPLYGMLYSYIWGDLTMQKKRNPRLFQLMIGRECDVLNERAYQKQRKHQK